MCQAWEGEYQAGLWRRKQEALAAEEAEARKAAAEKARTLETYYTELGRRVSEGFGVEPHVLLGG